jgi:hypothetical protein
MTRPLLFVATLLACSCSGAGSNPPEEAPVVVAEVPGRPAGQPEGESAAAADGALMSDERLDSMEALRQAQANGFEGTVIVPHAARCPAVAAPTSATNPLVATGALAGLVVDVDGFLRADVGVPEAVAALGRPALCNHEPGSRYTNMYLATGAANVRQATLETRDGELIGLVLEFEAPVTIDLEEFRRRFGAGRMGVGSEHLPPDHVFEAKSPAFVASFSLGRGARKAPAGSVLRVIFRRQAAHTILPDRFETADDLVRLAALALGSRAPDPVGFFGTLGVFGGEQDGTVFFHEASRRRNVAHATLQKTSTRPADTRAIQVTFAESVEAAAESFARDLALALQLPAPTITREGNAARFALADATRRPRGEVVLELAGTKVKQLAATRAP